MEATFTVKIVIFIYKISPLNKERYILTSALPLFNSYVAGGQVVIERRTLVL